MRMKHGRTTLNEAENEVLRFMEQKKRLSEQHLNKWGRTDILGKEFQKLYAKNPTKALKAATLVENQERALKSIVKENLYSTTFSPSLKPVHLLKAVFLGVANSKRGDIFTEIPLTTTDDILLYVQSSYGKSLRGANAGSRPYETVAPYYAGERYTVELGTGNGSITAFSKVSINPVPLIPFTIKILVNGAIVATDDGAGNLVGTSLSSGSVDYADGEISVTFSTAPANNASIVAEFHWDSERSDNYIQYGVVDLELVKTRFNARPMPLGYRISDMTRLMLSTTGIGDADEYLAMAVAQEHARSKDYKAIIDAKHIALSNSIETFDANFATEGEISYINHAQKLLFKIGQISASIYDSVKRGGVTHIVAGAQATEYMKLHDSWKSVSGDALTGVYQAGELDGKPVFTCPADNSLIATNEVLLIYRNPVELLDTSLVYGVLTELDASLRYPNFITEGNTCSVEDRKIIDTRFIRMLRINNLV